MIARWYWWLLAILWAGLIFILSDTADLPGRVSIVFSVPFADKLVHAGVFAVLAVFLFKAVTMPPLALWLSMFYGLTDELHQAFVEGRHSDVLDWFADSAGAALAIIVLAVWQGRAKQH